MQLNIQITPLTIVIIIVVIVVIVAVAFLVYRTKRKKSDPAYADKLARKQAYKKAITPAKDRLKREQKNYDSRLSKCADDIHAAEADREKKIKAQEKEIERIEDQYSAQIDSFSGVKLYRDRVETKGKSVRLNTQMKASVMTGREYLDAVDLARANAQQEASISLDENAAAPSATVPTEQQTTPDGYLIIHDGEDPSNADIKVELDERIMEEAKSFINKFNCAAADIDNLRTQKSQQIDAAKAELERIKNDKTAIDAAHAAYEKEAANRADLDKAQAAYDQAEYAARKMRDGL